MVAEMIDIYEAQKALTFATGKLWRIDKTATTLRACYTEDGYSLQIHPKKVNGNRQYNSGRPSNQRDKKA
jgi:hypothetical protein